MSTGGVKVEELALVESVSMKKALTGKLQIRCRWMSAPVLALLLGLPTVASSATTTQYWVLCDFAGIPEYARLLLLLGVTLLSVLVHELLHGVFLQRFTGSRMSLGIAWKTPMGPAPYATAPGFLTSRELTISLLAPQLLTLFLFATSCALSWFELDAAAAVAVSVGLFNLSGGSFDLLLCFLLRSYPIDAVCHDTATGLNIYSRKCALPSEDRWFKEEVKCE